MNASQVVAASGDHARRGELLVEDVRHRTTVTVSEAAQILGIGRNAAYEAAHRGDIPILTFGTRIVVPVAPLLRLLGIEES